MHTYDKVHINIWMSSNSACFQQSKIHQIMHKTRKSIQPKGLKTMPSLKSIHKCEISFQPNRHIFQHVGRRKMYQEWYGIVGCNVALGFAVNWAMVKWATENWATGKFGNGKFGNQFLVGSVKSATVKPGNGKLCNR